MGTEFATYFSVVKKHPGEESKLVIDYTVCTLTLTLFFLKQLPLCTYMV